MSASSAIPSVSAHVMPSMPARVEGSDSEHDGDADDGAVQAPIQAAPAPGTGTIIDKTA